MTAEKWLRQVREVDDEILLLRRSMLDAWTQATGTTISTDGVPVQSSSDPHKFDRMAELDETIYNRIHELSSMKAAAVRAISQLEDPRERQVLIAYYVDCRDASGRKKTWEMVAVELSLSFRQTMYARSSALKGIQAFCDRIA